KNLISGVIFNMSGSQPTWSADGSKLPSIDPHTKAKHLIIEQYIENLVITRYKKAAYGVTTFTFIDGFCGGGMYDDKDNNKEWEGSPIRLIKAVREAHKKSKRIYPEPLNVKFIFIDSKKSHLSCLQKYSMQKAGLGELVNEQPHKFSHDYGDSIEECEFIHGEFENLVNACILTVESRKGHSFFLLDPFGWTDVSMRTIRTINKLKGSEILYTYMIGFITRFLSERYTSQRRGFQEILEADNYYELANLEDNSIGEQCYLRDQTVKLFVEKGKSEYVYTFALIPRGENTVLYYLLHLSKNLTAVEVIKDCFELENNLNYQYHYEIYGYGFRTSDFYNQNQLSLEFNITKDTYEICIDKLDQDVGKLIFENPDGISYKEIRLKTMLLNPANKKIYNKYLSKYFSEKEIEIWRDGKLLSRSKSEYKKSDIIKVPKKYQLSFLSQPKFLKTDL
ncbi:three-Cys-motif partner protein TcmP, partial [Dolichospermum sp. ST_sed10]|nr:three-Cys-motif partner protein TcmP [Dolichospermum sp. ST_sed10]